MKNNLLVNNSSCLFLDRDGVINKRLVDDYVKEIHEFIFIDGVMEAIQKLQNIFKTIVIVTNQQGIGKGIYTTEKLNSIHQFMMQEFNSKNIQIDAVFFAPNLKSENSNMRKPEIGMALKAKEIFPHIDFNYSLMVGDSLSDMEFGKNAGMKTAYISNKNKTEIYHNDVIDYSFNSLLSLSTYFTQHNEH